MNPTFTFQRRLVVALTLAALFALLMLAGSLRESAPTWAKPAEAVVTLAVGGAGALIAAARGTTSRRFMTAMLLVIIAELVALNVFLNAACYLGGCGD